MNKGNKILFSLALGFVTISFTGIQISVYSALGMTIFVSLLTAYDLINSSSFIHKEPRQIENAPELVINKTNIYLDKAIKAFGEILLYCSIPVSFFIPYYVSRSKSIDEINQFQQSLTLYTLGIVIYMIAKEKKK